MVHDAAIWLDPKQSNLVFNALSDEREDVGKPVIRLYGVNAEGNSVAAHVHNFTAYFYIHIIEEDITLNPEDIEKFRLKLNRECQAKDACL